MKIKVKSILSFIIGLMLMLLISATILSSFIKFVFIKPEFYQNIFSSQDTEEQIYQEIQGDLEYALIKSNLPKEIAGDMITKEEVKDEYDSYFNILITYLSTGRDNVSAIDTEVYLKRFDDKVNNYFKDNSVVIDDKLNKDVAELRGSMGQIIKNNIEVISSNIIVQSSTLNKFASFTSSFDSNLYYLLYVGIIILAAAILLLWYRDISKGIRWLSSSLIAVGLVFTIIFFAGLVSKFYNNVIIYTPYLKQFVVQAISKDVKWLLINGVVILALGILVYIVARGLEKRRYKLEVK